MALIITSLRVDYRKTEGDGEVWLEDVPYAIVNCTFKIPRRTEDDERTWQRAKAESEDYQSVLTIDDPKKYEEWIFRQDFSLNERYGGYGRAWTHNDCPWQYLEKFDTFWFREWVADSPVTRAIINELDYYRFFNKLPSVYRHVDECIIQSHLRALQGYWD